MSKMRILLMVLLALSYEPSLAGNQQRLVITGSSTIAPLIADLAKDFEVVNPGTRIEVQSGGSSRGINDVRQGIAELGMVSRSLKQEEKDLFAIPIANDGICLIVHKENKIRDLSRQQILDIYLGRVKNWREVGGDDMPIVVVSKAEGRSTLELFLAHFAIKPQDIKASVIIGDNAQGIKTVAGNPYAVGYVSIGSAEYEAVKGGHIRLLSLDGIPATLDNVAQQKFPLSRVLNLVSRGAPTGLARKFVDYLQTSDAEVKIHSHFFVPLAKVAS